MKKVLFAVLVLLMGAALFFSGLFLGQANATGDQTSRMMGNVQRTIGDGDKEDDAGGCDYADGPGMMGEGYGPGMMGEGYGSGMMGEGYGPGMMGEGYGSGMMGEGYGSGMMGSMMMGDMMMGGHGYGAAADVDPLSIEDATIAIDEYLVSLGNDDLALGEVMIFDNHAYGQILDKSSESGAFEVLVDPASGNVYPEPGPNMMWNTEYSPMSGRGGNSMMGGMMGNGMMGGFVTTESEITLTGEEAKEVAQEYLDSYLPGTTADETVDSFPGYFTIHTLRDGETSGMLSVNAYTGQVFLHHWHGDFLEMAGEEHD